MRKTINDKFYDHLNEQFRVELPIALTRKFGDKGFETSWSLLSGGLVTGWKKRVTPAQKKEIEAFLYAYEQAFVKAMDIVYYFNRKDV